jgi:ribosome-associated protein
MIQKIISSELTFNTSRSGGKGGQHVNKTESKVELVFDLENSEGFSDDEKEWLQVKLASKLKDGKIHIIAQTDRSQIKNKAEAVQKFFVLITKSLVKPKKRKPTKVSKAAKEKRLNAKKIRKEVKQTRRKIYT